MINQKFILGINYWPASKAMYWWKNWGADEVESDFKRISEAGFDKVRIFLLWEDFQPEIDKISGKRIEYLIRTLNYANKNKLEVIPTFFTGYMSGANWMPEWMLAKESRDSRFAVVCRYKYSSKIIRNFYKDEEIIESQIYQIKEISKSLRGHPSLWAWDLGNEPSNCVIPENKEQGVKWLKRMVSALKEVDQSIPVTIGMHMEDLKEDRNMGPAEAGKYCDFVCMHGYTSYCKWVNEKLDSELIPFLANITGWLAKKPLLFEAFGVSVCESHKLDAGNNSIIISSGQEAKRYYSEVLEGIYDVGCIGAFSWCYTDYRPKLWKFPPLDKAFHERFFGLWKYSGERKIMLETIKEFGQRASIMMDFEPEWANISSYQYYENPSYFIKLLYEAYLKSRIC